MFHSLLSDDRKHNATTTSENSKFIIELLQNRTVLLYDMSTILGNTYGCVNQYQCTTALYLLSILAHAYNIIIDRNVRAPVHGREIINDTNATDDRSILVLIKYVIL